jgi:hypothetical protein
MEKFIDKACEITDRLLLTGGMIVVFTLLAGVIASQACHALHRVFLDLG